MVQYKIKQYKSIIFITAIWLAVLFSGCIGKQEGTPTPTPTVTAAPPVTVVTPFPDATPTGNKTLVKLDSRRGFVPSNVTINTGDEIVWDNYYADTITLVSNDGLFDARLLAYHQQYRYIFKKPGTFTFYLEQNQNLNGTIIVETQATIPTTALPSTAPRELPLDTLYIDARMIKPAYWEKEKYELRSLQVQIFNQRNAPLSITAQIVSGEIILEEKTFILEREGSSYSFANDRVHFINNTNVTLRLLIQGYQPVEYKFKEVSSLS
jgi:plastocyanin